MSTPTAIISRIPTIIPSSIPKSIPTSVPIPSIVASPNAVVEASPLDNMQAMVEFFGTRNFAKLFGVIGVGGTAIVAYMLYRKYKTEIAEQETFDGQLMFDAEQRALVEAEQRALVEAEERALAQRLKEEENRVILYQVPRGFFTPAVAPFALKLETYMRVASISYEVHLSTTKQQVDTPWLKVGHQEIRESKKCISHLSNKFGIDLNPGSSSSRKTASRMVDSLMDNNVYWAIALWRWVYDEGKSMKDIQPLSPTGEGETVLNNVKESVMRAAHYHGIGRYSEEEVIATVLADLGHINAALGKHPYFLGDYPGEVDCNAFSLLAQMVWNMPGSPFEDGIKRHKGLMDFVIRMRENFWPDWDELIQDPQSSQAASKISVVDPNLNQSVKRLASDIQSSLSISASFTPVAQQEYVEENNPVYTPNNEDMENGYETVVDDQSNFSDPSAYEQSNNAVVMQLRNPQSYQRQQNPEPDQCFEDAQNQQQQYQQVENTQNEQNSQYNGVQHVDLTQEQLNQLQNHQQLLMQTVHQNAFQRVRDEMQNLSNQFGNHNFATPQSMSSGIPMNYEGEYYPATEQGYPQEDLQRDNDASLFQAQQYDQNLNNGYPVQQYNDEQCFQEPVQSVGYADQGYLRPGSNQSQIYNKYWN